MCGSRSWLRWPAHLPGRLPGTTRIAAISLSCRPVLKIESSEFAIVRYRVLCAAPSVPAVGLGPAAVPAARDGRPDAGCHGRSANGAFATAASRPFNAHLTCRFRGICRLAVAARLASTPSLRYTLPATSGFPCTTSPALSCMRASGRRSFVWTVHAGLHLLRHLPGHLLLPDRPALLLRGACCCCPSPRSHSPTLTICCLRSIADEGASLHQLPDALRLNARNACCEQGRCVPGSFFCFNAKSQRLYVALRVVGFSWCGVRWSFPFLSCPRLQAVSFQCSLCG